MATAERIIEPGLGHASQSLVALPGGLADQATGNGLMSGGMNTDHGLTMDELSGLETVFHSGISENTRTSYSAQWRRFREWADRRGVKAAPARSFHVAAYLVERMRVHGHKPATLRSAAAAITFVHRTLRLPDPCADESVRRTLRGVTRIMGMAQKQAEPMTEDRFAMVRATACIPRTGGSGRTESREAAMRRGLMDIAMIGLMRDCLLRISEAATVRWADLTLVSDGTARLLVPRSKTDLNAEGQVCFVSGQTVSMLRAVLDDRKPSDMIIGVRAAQIARRIARAALEAGLGEGYSGHSPRVGMSLDLAEKGAELPELMQAGRWKSPEMVSRYIRNQVAARGAVAKYYGYGV